MNLFVNAALLGFIPKSVKKGLMALAPMRRIKRAVLKDLGLPEDILTFVNFPTRYRLPRSARRAEGLGHRVPEAARLRLAPLGLLGAPSRPGAEDRPLAARHGRRQGRARHRRLIGHRPGGGLQVRRGRRHHRHLRPRRSQADRGEEGDPARKAGKGASVETYSADIADEASCKGLVDWLDGNARRRRLPGQQRRPLDPPRDRGELRALPRFRADDAAQLLRLPARHHGLSAGHGGEEEGPHRQHQLDRRADQRAALFGLRGLEGGARCLDALRVERIRRHGRQLHDHQHAAGAHADDRADQGSTTTCRCCRRKTRRT